MKPYYEHGGITIYHGDCREILPTLHPASFDAVITDPVWPNMDAGRFDIADPWQLFADAYELLPIYKRLVVQLGCHSDPRFLGVIPRSVPFIRVCWLEYACPGRRGRILQTSDVAYVFGEFPPAEPGRHLLSGWCLNTDSKPNGNGHPSPRRLTHLNWLVTWYAKGDVLDPFCGSGTTLIAAKHKGRRAIGIEIVEKYCEIAAKRLSQEVFDFDPVGTLGTHEF